MQQGSRKCRALITGATSGLGERLFEVFESNGWDVVGTTPSLNPADSKNILYWRAQDYETTWSLLASLDDRWNWTDDKIFPVEALINCAGINGICEFEKVAPSFVRHLMDVNFVGPVFLIQALLRHLQMSPHGVVCNVVSDASYRPMRHSLAYNCSKAAMAMATKQLARELTKPYDVSVFSVNPGKMHGTYMSTYIDDQVREVRGWTHEESFKYFASASVTGKESSPDDIAEIIFQLVHHPDKARMLSGACIDLVG
jgi:NAD(P)-dependent dehydrogenase (short-subunit alcohol dehydrogenase family)